MPDSEELHETVAVPALVTLVGEIARQARPEGRMSLRVIEPVNPFTADSVMVEVTDVPTLTEAGEVAAIVKSVMVNVAVAT